MSDTKDDMLFMEPSLKSKSLVEEEKTASAGAIDESMLSEDEKKQVEAFVNRSIFPM